MSCVVWASLQFNVVLDEGFQEGVQEWQFNNILVAESENGKVQFNNVLVTGQ
jgi:hypothetical protein